MERVSEVGGQRSEVGGRRSEVGGRRSEVGGRNLLTSIRRGGTNRGIRLKNLKKVSLLDNFTPCVL